MSETEQNLEPEMNLHWQRRKEFRPVEIINAAQKIFVRQGFSSTKVADIAKEAGIQAGTIYVYFDSKEAIFKAVIENSIQPLLDVANEIVDNFTGPAQELIKTLIFKWWELLESDSCRGIPKLITSESRNFPELASFYTKEMILPARAFIYRILEYAKKQNQLQLLNMEYATRVIFQILHQMLIYQHSFAEFESNPISEKMMLQTTADFIIRSVLIPQQ